MSLESDAKMRAVRRMKKKKIVCQRKPLPMTERERERKERERKGDVVSRYGIIGSQWFPAFFLGPFHN